MRLSALWVACALSFAAHAVGDVDSSNTSIQSTTPSLESFSILPPSAPILHDSRDIPNAHVFVIISTGIATSTVTLDSNEKGDSTTCLTYTTVITHTYTRTRTTRTGDSSINTGTLTGDSPLVTTSVTSVLSATTSGVTINPDASNTEGADTIVPIHTETSDTGSFSTGVPTTSTNPDTSITETDVASASDSSTTAADVTNTGSSNGSSATDGGTINTSLTSLTGTANNPGTDTVTGIAATDTTSSILTEPGATNSGAVTGSDTSAQTSFTSSTPNPSTTIEVSHPLSTESLTHSTAIPSPGTTSDDSDDTSSEYTSISTVNAPESITSTLEDGQPSSSETLPSSSVISTATTDEDGTTQVAATTPDLVTTSIDEEGNPTTNPVVIPTTTEQSMPSVISTTTTTTNADGNTMTVPLVISTTIVHTVPGLITTTDGSGGITTVPNGITLTTTDTAPHGIVTTTTDEGGAVLPMPGFITTTDSNGGIVTVSQGVTLTTTDASGIVGTVYPGTTTTDGPIAIAPLPGYLISSSMSSISSEFRKLLPLFTSWEKYPSPPLQTHIINGIDGIKGIDGINIDIKDLFPKLGKGSAPGCPSKRKRGLFDGLLDLAGDAIDTIANALSCITDNLKRLKTELEGKNIKGVKNILDKLITPDPKPSPSDDNPPGEDPSSSTSASSTSSSSSSSTCTSDTTAYQVTILCQPISINLDGSTVSTTTCSPTTTITTSGCSITDTTTTVTKTPTSTPTRDKGCAADSCGEMCSAGGISGGWITLGPINCARLSTSTVAALPTASQGAFSFGSKRSQKDSILVKRVDDPPAESPLPDLDPGSDLLNEYLTEISRRMARETQWLLYMRVNVRGKWYPFTEQKTAAGVGPLYGCTSVFVVSRMGAYLAHIFENPVFIMDDEEGFFETPDFHFHKWSFNALARGGPEFPGVEPIQALVGTDENPGPLHYSLEPRVFVVTPFEEGLKEGNLEYEDRAVWLTDQLRDFLYPRGCADQNQPMLAGYEQVGKLEAQKLDNPAGKAIVEATPIQFWLETGDQQLAVGRWRLWIGGKKFAQYDFWDPESVSTGDTGGSTTTSAGGQAIVRAPQLGGPQAVCPVSFSSTSTPSTFITTTKSSTTESLATTTTETRTRPHGPAGQPPSFTLPTATVTRPHGPAGQPPDFTLPTAPHEPPTTTTADPNTPPQPIPATTLPPILCYEKENIKPDPIDEVAVQHLADFCSRGLKGDELNLGPGSKPVKFNAASPKGFPFYYVDILYVDSCSDGTGARQSPQFPMVGFTCASIIAEIFKLKTCDTKNGYGGELIMGCLKYAARTFGKGKGS